MDFRAGAPDATRADGEERLSASEISLESLVHSLRGVNSI